MANLEWAIEGNRVVIGGDYGGPTIRNINLFASKEVKIVAVSQNGHEITLDVVVGPDTRTPANLDNIVNGDIVYFVVEYKEPFILTVSGQYDEVSSNG